MKHNTNRLTRKRHEIAYFTNEQLAYLVKLRQCHKHNKAPRSHEHNPWTQFATPEQI